MNSSSAQKTYINMQNVIVKDAKATCMLVEVIVKKSQNKPWKISLDNKKISTKNIRRVSIDKFYEIVTGDKLDFYKLCNYLPIVINKVISSMPEFKSNSNDTVLQELKNRTSKNLLDALYNLSFKTYYGWNKINVNEE